MEPHPIPIEKAKELLAGDLGNVYRKILMDCCAPIYWFRRDIPNPPIAHNGTLTIARTPKALLGITAAHVLEQFSKDCKAHSAQRLQVANVTVGDFMNRVVGVSTKLDIATIELDEDLLKRLGKTPLGEWPAWPPHEGRGIMIGGYPAAAREESTETLEVNYGLFTALGVARTVTQRQVTWLIEPEFQLSGTAVKAPPAQYDLGGISGGPLISWFETEQHVTHHRLSAIVTEHPDYAMNSDVPPIARLVAIRADAISETGKIYE
ncbi:hypothetical protein QTH91_14570 [Variovorax dokdonensis]|uniref:Serine protease n=1 Tax=Variovorax dokdonensis TaxID=344883 RepID=A0ABT7NCR1_9BURK|nr:hypothetical protein [Variovorax dokdonensis]MDM0045711.1 hypothetical protein [Variovorax dokdonensis]